MAVQMVATKGILMGKLRVALKAVQTATQRVESSVVQKGNLTVELRDNLLDIAMVALMVAMKGYH